MRVLVKNLHKAYSEAGNELIVINELNVEFKESSRNAIAGISGIGKSTLLHLLGGLDRPSAGSICYEDQDIFSLSDETLAGLRGRSVGFIFQFHHLLPEFNALENAAMPLLIAGVSQEESESRAKEILEEVGLGQRLAHRPGQLSGGEQQRVAIARALIIRPRLLLADEPTGNLDYKTAAEIQNLIKDVSQRYGTTLIIVTHNKELASSMDHVFEMMPGGNLTPLK